MIKLQLTGRYVIGFLALHFVMHELHEQFHIITAWAFCDCIGSRDFNVLHLCESCNLSWISGFAGPFFSFGMIWIGFYLLHSNKIGTRSIGFSLVFANLPFARLFTVLIKGGDELGTFHSLARGLFSFNVIWAITVIVVCCLITPPLLRSYKSVAGGANSVWIFLLFLFAPLFIDVIVLFIIMNSLLKKNIISSEGLLGTPLLILIWTSVSILILMVYSKHLKTLFQKRQK